MVAMLKFPDCRLYVDSDVSETELASLVTEVIYASRDFPRCEADIARNDEYDSRRRREFPDGFVYFSNVVDLYIDEASLSAKVLMIGTMLEYLWDWGLPTVAVCTYEKLLPANGGYRSESLPWPEA